VQKLNATQAKVCQIAADLLNVERSAVTVQTSLGTLRADELDFVELVMELEEAFDLSISDESAERMMGGAPFQEGIKNVTMGDLAALVDKERQKPKSDDARPHQSRESFGKPKVALPDALGASSVAAGDLAPLQVKVFLNPLVVLLAGAEKQKGQPLTRDEVLAIRDAASFVMMSPEQADRFYAAMDKQVPVYRINPEKIWEEWQEIRLEISSSP
jgi:acyl carrier protein